MTQITPKMVQPTGPQRMRWRGFTLIELMITVAIVAILASVALPAYQNSVKKGKRAQGRAALIEAMQAQERYFTQRNTYLALGLGVSQDGIKMTSGDNPATAAYKLTASACSGSLSLSECVKLQAIPQYTDAEIGTYLEMLSTGVKSCQSGNMNVCWP